MLIQTCLGGEKHVIKATSLAEAREKLKDATYDLILLDVGLPDGDGLQFCSEIKNMPQHVQVPVFFLTGRSDTINKVMAFNLGAEDYIVKPFDPLELKARIEARIRKQTQPLNIKVYGGIKIDFIRNLVELQNNDNTWEAIDLTLTEYKVLTFLVQNMDAVLSRNQIIEFVWGPSVHILDRNVDSHVSSLRKKLKSYGAHIRAVHGLGYRYSKELSGKKKVKTAAA